MQALNKGTKPPIIADRIEVKELHMGTVVSVLAILCAVRQRNVETNRPRILATGARDSGNW